MCDPEKSTGEGALVLESNKYKQPSSGSVQVQSAAPRLCGIHTSSNLLIISCIGGLSVGFNTQQSFIRFQILSFAMVSGRGGVPPLATLAITVNIGYSWYGSLPVKTS